MVSIPTPHVCVCVAKLQEDAWMDGCMDGWTHMLAGIALITQPYRVCVCVVMVCHAWVTWNTSLLTYLPYRTCPPLPPYLPRHATHTRV